MSRHKRNIVKNAMVRLSEEYIVTTLRAHHYLTYILYPITLVAENEAFEDATVSFELDDILSPEISMANILKNDRVKNIFDTDEISTLHNFTYLRNSLAHSADYVAFLDISEDYYDSVMELLDNVNDIFSWAALNIISKEK